MWPSLKPVKILRFFFFFQKRPSNCSVRCSRGFFFCPKQKFEYHIHAPKKWIQRRRKVFLVCQSSLLSCKVHSPGICRSKITQSSTFLKDPSCRPVASVASSKVPPHISQHWTCVFAHFLIRFSRCHSTPFLWFTLRCFSVFFLDSFVVLRERIEIPRFWLAGLLISTEAQPIRSERFSKPTNQKCRSFSSEVHLALKWFVVIRNEHTASLTDEKLTKHL